VPRDVPGPAELDLDDATPIYVISVAAQLAGMHPQTLRQYDRIGLVSPGRARGRGRRYSARDVAILRDVQRLSQDGVSLAGIKRILELESQVDALRARVQELRAELERVRVAADGSARVFAAGPGGEVITVVRGRRPARSSFGAGTALVIWRPPAR
jgi:MerR family transcriptional regulator, heat shock protein HspR